MEKTEEVCECFLPVPAKGKQFPNARVISVRPVDIDFGKVEIGKDKIVKFTLENNKGQTVIFMLDRHSYVLDTYRMFYFNKNHLQLESGTSGAFKIKYKPSIANEIHTDTFHVTCSNGEIMSLYVKGESIGPLVKCSIGFLSFVVKNADILLRKENENYFKTPLNCCDYAEMKKRDEELLEEAKVKTKTIELTNVSDATAIYQFDIDEADDLFQLSSISGEIAPGKHMYIKVLFQPKEMGIFTRQLFCLILHQEPIVIDLLGIYTEKTSVPSFAEFRRSTVSARQNTFDRYFKEYSTAPDFPITLNDKYIDFGKVLYDKRNLANYKNYEIGTTSLTNNMDDEITVKWEAASNSVFFIEPRETVILSKSSKIFECKFIPQGPDAFFAKIWTAQVFWKEKPKTPGLVREHAVPALPMNVALRLQGNSFPGDQCWLCTIEVVPDVITISTNVPGETSSATFMLKSSGHLPVLFRFIPPIKSCFIVKPMMGMFRFFKILAVRINALPTPHCYAEDWRVIINGQLQKLLFLKFRAATEIPSIRVGDNDEVFFKNVQPGCRSIMPVAMKNTSGMRTRVSLNFQNKYLSVKPEIFELHPNDNVIIEWTFYGVEDAPTEFVVKCQLWVVLQSNTIGPSTYEHDVTIKTHCVYSQLCATPRCIELGQLCWSSKRSTNIELFNFGNSIIYFKLCDEHAVFEGKSHDRLTFNKPSGTLRPGEHINIQMELETTTIGDHCIKVLYKTRVHESSVEISNAPPVEIFQILYQCSYPTVIIKEIVHHDFAPVFNKSDLWNHLNASEFNEILRTIEHHEAKEATITLPTFSQSEVKYTLAFILKNITDFDVKVSLKKQQLCNCTPVNVTKGFTFRQQVFTCPHRHMLNLHLSNDLIAGNSNQLLEMTISYLVPREQSVAYLVSFDAFRSIKVSFIINTIPKGTPQLTVFHDIFEMKFLNTYIGLRDPPLQSFWIYNTTQYPTTYKLEEVEMIRMCNKEGFNILQCLNPSGEIDAFSKSPLLFRFRPIECKSYELTTLLVLGDEYHKFHISGEGTMINTKFNDYPGSSPSIPLATTHDGAYPVTTSTDYIIVKDLPVWSSTEKVLFVRNISKDRPMLYHWQMYTLKDCLEVSVNRSNGILMPKESHMIRITVKALSNPIMIVIDLCCTTLDYKDHQQHEETSRAYNERQLQLEQEFYVDDEGREITGGKNEVVIAPRPMPKDISIAISIQTVSTLDIPKCLDIQTQFQQTPFPEMSVDTNQVVEDAFHDEVKGESPPMPRKLCKLTPEEVEATRPLFQRTMEAVIMEAIDHPVFSEILHCQYVSRPPYYIQFKTSDTQPSPRRSNKEEMLQKRKEEANKYLTKPSSVELSNALKEMLHGSVSKTFKL